MSDFHELTRDLGKGNAEDRGPNGDSQRDRGMKKKQVGERDVEGDRQTDAKVVAEVEAAKWKWKRSQIQAPPAAAM